MPQAVRGGTSTGPADVQYPPGETVLRAQQVNTDFVPKDRFRQFAWNRGFEDRQFHAAMQKMIAFDEMLYTLMT